MISNFIGGLASRSRSSRTRRPSAATKRLRLRKRLGCESLEQRRLLAGIFGYKFEDLNANGIDDGEPRLAGVEISVLVDDGASTPFSLTTITDTNGEYQFLDLPAATMTVTETPPPGSVQTTIDPAPFFLGATDNAVAVPGQGGTVIPELGFGNAFLGSIHGYKFEDINGNGVLDANEPPLPNVTFTLTDTTGQGQITLTTGTDANGEFWFTNLLPGDYTVTETVPAGFVATTPTSVSGALLSGQELVAFPGQAMLQVDSEAEDGTGDGSIMARTNASGGETVQLDAGESRILPFNVMSDRLYDVDIRYSNDNFGPLEIVEVSIDGGFVGAFIAQDTGDFGAGWENFLTESIGGIPLTAGPHTMEISVFGGDGFGVELDLATLTATYGEEVVIGEPLQFGNTVPGSIHGFKFHDLNGNGIYDPNEGETGIAGVEFTLNGTDGQNNPVGPIAVTTDGTGQFWFIDLIPGDYFVTETVPAGYIPTTLTQSFNLTIQSGQELVWQDGAAMIPAPQPPAVDVDQNAAIDDADDVGDTNLLAQSFTPTVTGGLTQVEISIDTSPGPVGDLILDIQTVDGAGLPSGTVLGSATILNANIPTSAVDQTVSFDFSGAPVSLPAGVQVALVLRMSAGGSGVDWNFSSGDPYAGGIALTSDDAGANWGGFGDEDHVFTTTMQPAPDPRFEVNVGLDLMFGNLALGSVHGFKFEDVDGDGVFNNADQPHPNVTFQLTGTDITGAPVNELAVTDAGGQFWFTNLYPSDGGGYDLIEILPPGFVATTPNVVNLVVNAGVELVYEDGAANIEPGLPQVEQNVGDQLVFGNTVPGSIHGFKFHDIDGDGVYDPNSDPAQPGVFFTLTGTFADGTPVQPIILPTDLNGEFWFTNLLPGNYTVTETVPDGFNSTTLPISRDFTINSRQELVWQDGAAMLPPSGPQIDQSQATGNVSSVNDLGVVLAQTFVPGITGTLTQVNVEVSTNSGFSDVIAEIQTVDLAGDPSGLVLASVTVPSSALRDGFGRFGQPLSIDFSAAAPALDAATSYAIVLSSPTSPAFTFGWDYATPGTYADGIQLFSSDSGVTWQDVPTNDQVFTTIMLPADVDPRVEVNVGDQLIFGNTVPGSVHGFKFLDINGNGFYEPNLGETPQAGVQFTLETITSDNAAMLFTATTDVNGEFWFTDLLPSVAGEGFATGYTLTEVVPDGFVNTTPTVRNFDLFSGEELVWRPGAAMLDPSDPQFEVIVGEELMFGNTIPGSIHGFKFEDVDGDGIYDPNAGDVPMPNVVFQLTGVDSAGNDIDTTVATNDQGEFWFTGLLPSIDGVGLGTGYTVTEIVPDGFFPTSVPFSSINPVTRQFDLFAGEELAWASGAAMLPPDSLQTEIVIGQQLMWSNATFGSIHGFKYEDVDGNGIYDPTIDLPQQGVVFELTGVTSSDGVLFASAVTDTNGEFWITGLQPSVSSTEFGTGYTLAEIVPFGFAPSTPTERFFNLRSRQELVWRDGAAMLDPGVPQVEVNVGDRLTFGNTTPGSIHGFKFEDLNGNGIYEPSLGDFPQAGVEFTLTGTDGRGLDVNRTEFTDAFGNFWFTDLWPSIDGSPTLIDGVDATGYTVTETVPVGYVPTTLPLSRDFDLGSREELVWVPGAALLPPQPLPVVDQVQFDGSAGFAEAADTTFQAQMFTPAVTGQLTQVDISVQANPGVGDVTLQIQSVDLATGEPSGSVLATVTIPAASVPIGGNQNLSFDFSGQSLTLAAGFTYAMVLSSTVDGALGWDFANTDPYAQGIAYQSLDSGGTWGGLPQVDYVFTTTMRPPGDPRVEVFIDPDDSGFNEVLMWGNTLPGQIHGLKFDDTDGDGILDPGEPRLEGWEFQLLDEAGNVVDTQITDANGEFWFIDLVPGTYFVREVQQLGWLQTTHDPQPYTVTRGEVYVAYAGLGMLDPFDVREETIDKCLNFGNILSASIHGYKFHDINGNGIDDNDPRLAGVTITLSGDVDGDGVEDQLTTQTDAAGEYWFEDLYPGTYTVSETVPVGFMPSKSISTVVTVGAGEEAVAEEGQSTRMGPLGDLQFESAPNLDLAFANTIKGSIHGHKFKDKDFDGFEDANEPRVAGVEIRLFGDVNGDGFAESVTTFTNQNGEYWFTDLWPGGYDVSEIAPPGTIQTAGGGFIFIESGEEEVAEAGQASRMGPVDPLGIGKFEGFPNPDILAFGNFYPGEIHGHKFEDLDGDGVEDAGEQRLNGFTIVLTDAQGNDVFDAFGQLVQPVVTTNMDLNGDGNITPNEQGLYWFENLLPGTYLVREIVPPVVDQAQLNGTATATAFGNIQTAQTFSPGVHGKLEQVEIRVTVSAPVGDVIMEIQTVDGFGQPTGQVIASSTVAAANVPIGANQQMSFGFIKPPHLLTGEQYAIVVRSPSTASPGDFAWDFVNANDYGGGTQLQSLDAGATWNSFPAADQVFTTTMTPYTGIVQTTHDPQPITITGGQIYVAQLDQNPYGHDPSRIVIVDKCLSFGNQLHGKITWDKVKKFGERLGGVIFELTQTHMYDQVNDLLMDVPDVTVTVVDNMAPDGSLIFGHFAVKDLPLGRYTLRETVPVPGYDLDPRVATIELTPGNFKQYAGEWENTWSKRAFVGSTFAARLAYLESIGLAEMELNAGGGGFGGAGAVSATTSEPFRVGLQLAESEDVVQMIHTTSGLTVGEGELVGVFDAITTDLDEYLAVDALPRLQALNINVAGGNDVIDLLSVDFDSLDGGDGHDVLKLRALGAVSLLGSSISGIEELELTSQGQTLTVNEALVTYLTGGTLRVRHQSGEQLVFDGSWEMAEPMIDGGEVVQILRSRGSTVQVINDNPWQNVLNRFDVDANGSITARDALIGINSLERFANGSAILASDHLPTSFFDVTGDNKLTALDALQIINQLASDSLAESEQVAFPSDANPAGLADTALNQRDEAEDLKSNSQSVASFDVDSSTAWSAQVVGEALNDNSENSGSDELETTLSLLATDGGR